MKPAVGLRFLVSGSLLASFLLALLLAASPQLHERVHNDAASGEHECAVTLIATGKYHHSSVPVVVIAPQPAIQFSNVPALHPVWVAAPFLSASVFEHAPPAAA